MLHEIAASDLDITNIVNPIRKLLKKVKCFMARFQALVFNAGEFTCGPERRVLCPPTLVMQ